MRAGPEREPTGPRTNDSIRSRTVRLINADGENVGVVETLDALKLAEEAGLDLVEVSPDANPPVAKILDYGKFKFQEQKKQAEARKKQKIVEIKEIKMRPSIDDHDYDVKMRAIKRFFEEGDKVKVTLRFRGREMAHQQLGMAVLQRVKAEVQEISKVESEPRLEGRQMVMVLAPKSPCAAGGWPRRHANGRPGGTRVEPPPARAVEFPLKSFHEWPRPAHMRPAAAPHCETRS
jgi:translation initiation factor IF-3